MASTTRTGAPIWIDLSTPDIPAAKAFYGELFGWEFTDSGADFGHYQMITQQGRPVGGAMNSQLGEETAPTAWGVYLRTEDSAATAQAVTDHGGQVLVEPMPVGDLGTMAIYLDPTGAGIGSWEVDQFAGFELPRSMGSPVWFELLSTDYDAADSFYSKVFGWQLSLMEPVDPTFRYGTNGVEQDATSGLCEAKKFLPAGTPAYWRIYLAVDDCDAAVQRIGELGGTLLDGPADSPFGRFATVADPQGASFQINAEPR